MLYKSNLHGAQSQVTVYFYLSHQLLIFLPRAMQQKSLAAGRRRVGRFY